MLNYKYHNSVARINFFHLYVFEMSFGQLPSELVMRIGKDLQCVRDQSALMRTNRGIYFLLRRQLYKYDVDHQHRSGLIWAVQKQKISVALYFLQLPGLNVNARDEDGRTLLHTACIENDGYYMTRILLHTSRIDLNAKDLLGRTPLSYLASSGNLFSLDMLLQCPRIDVNAEDRKGQTPLHFAVQDGGKRAVKKLLADSRVNPNLLSMGEGYSPLTFSIFKGDLTILEILLTDKRVDVNCTPDRGNPLTWSLLRRDENCALRLLRAPMIDINRSWPVGFSPLLLGVLSGFNSFVTELLKHDGVDINHQDDIGRTALMLAAEKGNFEALSTLLDMDEIDVNLRDINRKCLLDYAANSYESRVLATVKRKLADFS